MKLVVVAGPAILALAHHQEEVEQSQESCQQAHEQQLPEGGQQEAGEPYRGQAEMPGGREKAGEADPERETGHTRLSTPPHLSQLDTPFQRREHFKCILACSMGYPAVE